MTIDTIAPILQLAVSPVILISAIGLILLTLNNRIARSIDRARSLTNDKNSLVGEAREKKEAEIAIIYQRAKITRLAIVFVILSALASSILVISLFIAALYNIEVIWLYSMCFIAALLFLIIAFILFILEINKSLTALHMELNTKTP